MSVNLVLQRKPTVKATTLGELSLDGVKVCDTLEDVIREVPGVPVEQWKVRGQTAIPAGIYRLTLEHSPKFGPDTLTVNAVPGFVGVRVHAGNDDADSEGCPLVGTAVPDDTDGGNVVDSRKALAALKALVLPRLKAGEAGWIEIRNPEGGTP